MKKLLSLMGLIAASVMTANAQIVDTPAILNQSSTEYEIFPFGESLANNKEYVFYAYIGDKGYTGCTVYNKNFEVVKIIDFPEDIYHFEYRGDEWIGFERRVIVTQSVFNNDDDFEYLCPDRSQIGTDTDGYPITKITGFLLKNEDGEVLQKIVFPNNLYSRYSDSPVLLVGDGEKYLHFCDLTTDRTDNFHLLYKINKGGGSGVFTLACDPIKVEASPRMASKSEPITVTFDSDAVTRIEVVSVRGAVEEAFDVEAGAHSAIVDTSRLGKGMYIINVVADGVRSENCKVIIR